MSGPVRSLYTLTDAGWPRPVFNGYPVPWVAPQEDLGHVNSGRRGATVTAAICQVCGEGYQYGEEAYGFAKFLIEGRESSTLLLEFGDSISELPGISPIDKVRVVDGAVMHWRCARLTAARCPHIVRNRHELVCVQVPANDADPELDDIDGVVRPTYSVTDCYYAPWPTEGARHALSS